MIIYTGLAGLAEQIGSNLSQQSLRFVITSPLVRARQTAEIIADGLNGVEIIEEPTIAEVSYGR